MLGISNVLSIAHRRKITVFSLTLSAYSIEPGDEKPSGPDLLVSFHDNDHYNSIRDKKSPPELSSKLNKLNHRPWSENGSSEASESTCTNSTATASLSDMSLSDGIAVSKKAVKKNDTCPCGSGQRYRKCCLAKEKHAKRLGKMRGDSASEFDENDDEVAMKGNFQVLQI